MYINLCEYFHMDALHSPEHLTQMVSDVSSGKRILHLGRDLTQRLRPLPVGAYMQVSPSELIG